VTDTSTLTPLLVSEREAARLLGVSPRTVFTLRKQGHLKAVKIGASVRYDVRDIRAFINAAKVVLSV